MKKFLFLGLAAMMAFTSCTKDETLATAQNGAIGFDVAADKATRSNIDPSTTTANIENFAVYGWMEDATGVGGDVFVKEQVAKSGAAWAYTNTQYWTRNTYYFAAIAPYDGNWTVETKQSKTGIGTVTFENKDAAQDLLYWAGISENKGGESEDAPVSILFNHLLSKVKFTFENQFENELTTIKISDLKITNAYEKGTLDLTLTDWWTKPEWVCEGEQTFEFGDVTTTKEGEAEAIAVNAKMESDKEILLFPAADKTYKVTFTVTVLNGEAVAGEYTHNVELKTTFNTGFSYNIKAALNSANVNPEEELKPIEFTVEEIKDWMKPTDEYVELTKNASTEAELIDAINSGAGMITLTGDIEVSKMMTIKNNVIINLNGKTLNMPESATTASGYNVMFYVTEGGLTINGEGTVSTGAAKYSIPVWATTDNVVINGGKFMNAGEGSDLIYASGNGKITINGGEFIACEKQPGVEGTGNKRSTLNCLDASYRAGTANIYVKGGKFFQFNPADNVAEGDNTSFVVEGYTTTQDGDYYIVKK